MKEYIERSEQESILKKRYYELAGMRPDFYAGYMTAFHIIEDDIPNAADVIEADRLGRVGRLMLPYKGCPRGPIGRLGMAGGKTQDKKAILIEELCCMDTFEDVDGNVWRPVQEEVLQEVIEMLRNMEETVHCKDCDVPHNRWIGCRNLNGLIPPPDFYCAYGERKIDKEE